MKLEPLQPSKAIANLNLVSRRLKTLAEMFDVECEGVMGQWERLGRIGGKREDMAAEIMKPLAFELGRIERFAADTRILINEMADKPFAFENQWDAGDGAQAGDGAAG